MEVVNGCNGLHGDFSVITKVPALLFVMVSEELSKSFNDTFLIQYT